MNSLRVMGECRNLMFGDIEEVIALDRGSELVLAKILGLL